MHVYNTFEWVMISVHWCERWSFSF